MASNNNEFGLETAHVLFMDIVGYSELLIDDQTKLLGKLQQLVRDTKDFQRAEKTGELLRLPTGDGIALSFFGDPEAPIRCAAEISTALRQHSDLKLRMGVNTGLVYRLRDINANLNVAGGGINLAQRVMDCGDAGHILLSKGVAEDIGQLNRWAKSVHDLGEAQVKHGRWVHVYNLYNNEIGNPNRPTKLQARKKAMRLVGRMLAIVGSLLLIAIAIFVWNKSRAGTNLATQQSLATSTGTVERPAFTYYLTPSVKERLDQIERFTGNEQFRNGSRFTLVLDPQRAGAFYLVNKGKGPKDATTWNVLFPIPENNAGSPWVEANQELKVSIKFDAYSGDETLWIIWTATPDQELDRIFKRAVESDYEVMDSSDVETIVRFLAKYESPKPTVEVDAEEKVITVMANANEKLVTSRVLKHREF